jgi:hypothetical protein
MNTELEMLAVETRWLRPGDLVYTGETVIRQYADSKTTKGKRTVELNRDGVLVRKEWNAGTTITVWRKAS